MHVELCKQDFVSANNPLFADAEVEAAGFFLDKLHGKLIVCAVILKR